MSEPLAPTLVADRFAPLGRELVALLKSLAAADWARPTIAGTWRVRDVAAHLLDTACRRVSLERDGVAMPPPDSPLRGDADLVAFLNRRNAEWVEACRRLSPSFLIAWLEGVEPQLAAVIEGLDPWSAARFGVSWAGEETSLNWFDTARELTERWHHQEQIRLAVGRPSLDDPFYLEPVMDTFLRVLPFRYRGVVAAEGAELELRLTGREALTYVLRCAGDEWAFERGRADSPAAAITIETSVAWRLLTKGMSAQAARAAAALEGEKVLLEPFFGALAIVG